jgi:hypothetical protein
MNVKPPTMTTLEQKTALLAHYNLAKQMVQEAETFEDAKRIIFQMHVQRGICYCSRLVFEKAIVYEEWAIRNARFGNTYWRAKPGDATTKEQIIERLQRRIDILTKEINIVVENDTQTIG